MYFTVEDTFQFMKFLPDGNLLEFGVYTGNCLNRLIKAAESANKPFINVYGFDSFIGLPEETPGVLHNPEWSLGTFSACKEFGVSCVEEAKNHVRQKVERKDIALIDGFFKDSLTEKWGKRLKNSVSYAHIDVDLYSSTVEVLDFIFTHQILKPGSIFRYDDWIWSNYALREYEAGNSLAHIEMVQKYKPVIGRLGMNVFQLMSYS